jgi:hypothetical protein
MLASCQDGSRKFPNLKSIKDNVTAVFDSEGSRGDGKDGALFRRKAEFLDFSDNGAIFPLARIGTEKLHVRFRGPLQVPIGDFGFEMQAPNFKIGTRLAAISSVGG